MDISTATAATMAIKTISESAIRKEGSNNAAVFANENHVLHFNQLPPYMIQDLLDLLTHCKINDWTIDNQDRNTILSFRPEVKSAVDAFYENLSGYQIQYNRMAF